MKAVVSHDAGGAEILSSYVRRCPGEYRFVLAGPAVRIFERKLGSLSILPLEAAIEESDEVWCGSGWQSRLECDAIEQARVWGRRSVVFLDHWVNYRERLTREGQLYLPDSFCVGDEYAERIANAVFPGIPVRIEPNPFLLDIQGEFGARPLRPTDASQMSSVLYLTEPVAEHARQHEGDERSFGYTEQEALEYFLANVHRLVPAVRRIVLRQHPAEPAGKYWWASGKCDVPIIVGGARSLVEEIDDSDVVVGSETMAMVVALLSGKPVYSSIPPGGPACSLPQREIALMRDVLPDEPEAPAGQYKPERRLV